MLQQLRIAPRLIFLLILHAIALVTISVIAARGFMAWGVSMEHVNANANEQSALGEMNQVLQVELANILDDILAARITWEQGRSDASAMRNLLASQWTEYQHDKTTEELALIEETLSLSLNNVYLAFAQLDRLLSEADATQLTTWRHSAFGRLTYAFESQIDERVAQQRLNALSEQKQGAQAQAWYLYGGTAVLVLALTVLGLTSIRIYRSIFQPLRILETRVRKVAEGQHDVRVGLRGRDELGMVSRAIDQILDERNATSQHSQYDQDQQQHACIALLQTLGELNTRNFMARAPAGDATTAPLAGAVNQLAHDTGQILASIRRIAEQVATTTAATHAHVDVMMAVCENEKRRVEATLPTVAMKSHAVPDFATVLQNITTTTQGTLEIFTDSSACLGDVNHTLRDTHTHARQLSDQARTINEILDAFKGITERAHVISVNASMQAVTGGDGGRGGASTAVEMQRVAENIRDATRHVTALMAELQRTAQDQLSLLDSAITQVTATTQVAQFATEQLQQVYQHAADGIVATRAWNATDAAVTGARDTVETSINAGINAVHEHLAAHRHHTQRLTHFSRGLLTAMKTFTLPAEHAVDANTRVARDDVTPSKLRKIAS